MDVRRVAQSAREASRRLGAASSSVRNEALLQMADALERRMAEILQENEEDLAQGRRKNLPASLLDRLLLDEHRIKSTAEGIRALVGLPDPVGEVIEGWRTAEGLAIEKRRVPFGVVAVIYESRPQITSDAAALCIKTGNAVILRGGTDSFRSNRIMAEILTGALIEAELPREAIQFIGSTDRSVLVDLLQLSDLIDLAIPRGGEMIQQFLAEHSRIPVIFAAGGNCHVFVDRSADLDQALSVVLNSKVQRPGVGSAAETLLVHRDVAASFLPRAVHDLRERGVRVYADEATREVLQPDEAGVLPATEQHFATEFLALEMAVRVVHSIEEALEHIARYGTGHSEAIVTRDLASARRFTDEVDAAAVYVNASTRFTDGAAFGLGAEIGISTQKLHARGPLAMRELTSTKYVVFGDGQVR